MSNQSEGKAKVIVVCSPKGGAGRSIVAVNLGIALVKANFRVCFIDGDFQFGDSTLLLDMNPGYTVLDYIESRAGGQETDIKDYVLQHSSGLFVLAPPPRPEYAEMIQADDLGFFIESLSRSYDFIVVDTSVGFQNHTITAIDRADEILLVSTMELSSLQATRLYLDILTSLGMKDKVRLIMNRVVSKSEIQLQDIERIFPEMEPVMIPDQPKVVTTSVNRGIPLVATRNPSDVARAIIQLAYSLHNQMESRYKEQPSGGKALFKKLFKFSGRQKEDLDHEPSPTT